MHYTTHHYSALQIISTTLHITTHNYTTLHSITFHNIPSHDNTSAYHCIPRRDATRRDPIWHATATYKQTNACIHA